MSGYLHGTRPVVVEAFDGKHCLLADCSVREAASVYLRPLVIDLRQNRDGSVERLGEKVPTFADGEVKPW